MKYVRSAGKNQSPPGWGYKPYTPHAHPTDVSRTAKNRHLQPSQATACKDRQPHSVRVRVRVRVGWSALRTTAKPPLHMYPVLYTWYRYSSSSSSSSRIKIVVVVVVVVVVVRSTSSPEQPSSTRDLSCPAPRKVPLSQR